MDARQHLPGESHSIMKLFSPSGHFFTVCCTPDLKNRNHGRQAAVKGSRAVHDLFFYLVLLIFSRHTEDPFIIYGCASLSHKFDFSGRQTERFDSGGEFTLFEFSIRNADATAD
ncbi:hypothetical protein [Erwinia amylovora]|uniref:hypothetical protein n=1 Tax=Erwinia amylovora TaxID=552 RepID=UPI001443BCB1|nr:hypothetical protein [Erwinia amylovora]